MNVASSEVHQDGRDFSVKPNYLIMGIVSRYFYYVNLGDVLTRFVKLVLFNCGRYGHYCAIDGKPKSVIVHGPPLYAMVQIVHRMPAPIRAAMMTIAARPKRVISSFIFKYTFP